MRRTVSIWPLCGVIICALFAFFMSSSGLLNSIKNLEQKYGDKREKLTQLETEQGRLKEMVKIVGTDAFIESQARTLFGYMKPDEIRFVFTNPEVLYGMENFPK